MHIREVHFRNSMVLMVSFWGPGARLALPVGTGGISFLGSQCLKCWCPESPGNATCEAVTATESLN